MRDAKEFYFIRHGQTDHHYDDPHISLNKNGIRQAYDAKNLVSALHLGAVCHSPLTRAVETKNILFEHSYLSQYELDDLEECTASVWQTMTDGANFTCPDAKNFIQQTVKGINSALSKPGPVLVVAHGGIHYAFCKHHKIQNHSWMLDNCALIRFNLAGNQWSATALGHKTNATN
ncbi:MAG: histidine phosphatase family protein [Pseudomonadota bacterium]